MADISTEQIVKMVIAVLVLAVVVAGVYFGYGYYFKNYFQGLGPDNGGDYNVQNQEIVKNLKGIAYVTTDSKHNYITFEEDSIPSKYYICQGCWFTPDGTIYRDNGNPAWPDTKVGFVDNQGAIRIIQEFIGEDKLAKLEGAIKSFNKIAK